MRTPKEALSLSSPQYRFTGYKEKFSMFADGVSRARRELGAEEACSYSGQRGLGKVAKIIRDSRNSSIHLSVEKKRFRIP